MIVLRKFYSEPEQREYGLVSDLYHSGLKRTWKKNVGRGRKRLAKEIDDSMWKDLKKAKESGDKFRSADRPIKDEKLHEAFRKEAEKQNARVLDRELDLESMGLSDFATPNKQLKENIDNLKQQFPISIFRPKGVRKLLGGFEKSFKEKKHFIATSKNSGVGEAFHELGHIINENRNPKKWYDIPGKIKRAITNRGAGASARKSSDELIRQGKIEKLEDNSTSIKEAWKRFKDAKAIQAEEKLATREALKKLKENGATKEQLKHVKKYLGYAGGTYGATDIMYKSPIKNKVQIPSRRPAAEKEREKREMERLRKKMSKTLEES